MAFEISELIQSGNLPQDWSVCKVGDIADVNSNSISKRSPPTEIAYLDISSVSTRNHDKPKSIKYTEAPSRAQRIVSAGDTLIATVRPNLRAFVYIKKPVKNLIASTGFACVTPKIKSDALFLHYFLTCESFIEYLVRLADGAAYPAFDYKLIPQSEMPLPPIAEREEIGAFLGAIDDRIALLRETNATLEAIAQALFKSWFVDFDPVHAKRQGIAPEGMDEATAALFPDGFEESELGLMPRGWSYVSLKEVVSIYDSKRVPLSGQDRAKRQGQYPYYGAAALMDYVDDYLFDGVFLLTGEDGSVADAQGYPITQYVWGKFWVNNHAHILQGKNGVSTEHLMLSLRQTNIEPFITGAVQAKLSQSNMWRIMFLKPSQQISECFGALLEPLYSRLRHNSEQAQTLAALRDTLLPRLISGQLRIPYEEGAVL